MRKSTWFYNLGMITFCFTMLSIFLQIIIGDIFLLFWFGFFCIQLMSYALFRMYAKKELAELQRKIKKIKREIKTK